MAIGDEKQTQAGRAALACLARGWSVIPVKAFAKRPIVRWEAFQNRLPTREEVEGWFRRWPDANLGIVTGAISGLVVLDVDPRHRRHHRHAGRFCRHPKGSGVSIYG